MGQQFLPKKGSNALPSDLVIRGTNMDLTASSTVVAWLTLAIYNGAIIRILSVSISSASMKQALREKDPASNIAAASNAARQEEAGEAPTALDNTSYSRAAGMIGATVMACFLWALGNLFILLIFQGRLSDVKATMSEAFLGERDQTRIKCTVTEILSPKSKS